MSTIKKVLYKMANFEYVEWLEFFSSLHSL